MCQKIKEELEKGEVEGELKVCFVYVLFMENGVLYNLENCRQYRMRRRQNILFYMSVDKMKLWKIALVNVCIFKFIGLCIRTLTHSFNGKRQQ